MQPYHNERETKETPFQEGNTVSIINEYKSKKGVNRIVTRSKEGFTFLKDKYKVVNQRAHHNIVLITKRNEAPAET